MPLKPPDSMHWQIYQTYLTGPSALLMGLTPECLVQSRIARIAVSWTDGARQRDARQPSKASWRLLKSLLALAQLAG